MDSVKGVQNDLVGSVQQAPTIAPQLVVLSANTPESLKRQKQNCQDYLTTHRDRRADVSYTLSQRREHLPHRTFLVVGDNSITDTFPFTKVPGSVSPITMVFGGQGSQWPEMARNLLETDSNFRNDVVAMDDILKGLKHPPTWTIESKLNSFIRCQRILTPGR